MIPSDHICVSPCDVTDISKPVTRTRTKRKHSECEERQNVVSPVSSPVGSYHSFDAAALSLDILTEMQRDSGVRFNCEVDFRSLPIHHINLLFPKYNRYGQNDPPLNRRRNGKIIREFRLLSSKSQMVLIEKEKNTPNLQSTRYNPCSGISLNCLCKNDVNSVEDVRAGFRLLIAEALHKRANKIGNKCKWLYGSACGVLFDFNSKSDNQQAKFLLYEKNRPFAKDDTDRFYFLCAKCTVTTNTDTCQDCACSMTLLRKRCIRASNNVSDDCFIEGSTRNSIMSPSVCKKKLNFLSKKIQKVTNEKRNYAKKILQLELETNGIKLNFSPDLLSNTYSKEVEAEGEKDFDDKQIDKDDLRRLLFKEMCQNMRKIAEDPKKKYGIRHSPEILRYAAYQRNKLKDNSYAFNAKMLGWPSISTLNAHSGHGANEPAGIVYSTLETKRK